MSQSAPIKPNGGGVYGHLSIAQGYNEEAYAHCKNAKACDVFFSAAPKSKVLVVTNVTCWGSIPPTIRQ